MTTYKPILINMPIALLEQLDNAAEELDLSRSETLRRCLKRDLAFIASRQLRRFNEAKDGTMEDYSTWTSTMISKPYNSTQEIED